MSTLGLHTDLYEINMAYAYFKHNHKDVEATFEVYFRKNPFNNGHCVYVGSLHLIEAIKEFRYSEDDIKYLESLGYYDQEFLEYLKNFAFKGNILAPMEGEVIFANEPILVITGNLIECQLIETLVLNIFNFQTLIATKASKMRLIIDKPLYEFGARRGYELDASLWGSRASYIAGFNGTSLVSAAKRFDIPCVGTHAHSYIQMHNDQYQAFSEYATTFKDVTFLVDTYDVVTKGIPDAIQVAKENNNFNFNGIRIDSGDLAKLSKQSRILLDQQGYNDVKIMVSNDIDEHIIVDLEEQGAPIDAFGIGTKLVSCSDSSSLGGVYKLVHLKAKGNERDVIKLSNSKTKVTNPGLKMPYRLYNQQDQAICDMILPLNYKKQDKLIGYNDEFILGYQEFYPKNIRPLLQPIINNGEIVLNNHTTKQLQDYNQQSLNEFSNEYLRYSNPQLYPICLSEELYHLKLKLINENEE